jgi:hypothetical protein
LEDLSTRGADVNGDHEFALREKDEEIEVYKSGMEQALLELEELKLVCLIVLQGLYQPLYHGGVAYEM